MSIKIMSLVWDNFKKGGSEKLAMLALADWCDDAGSRLYPSILTIANKINVSECQARRIIHGFIDQGYLTVIANHSGGDPGKSRHYQLNIDMFTPSMDDTPSASATPSMGARYPYHPCALPLAPMLPDTLLTVKETLLKESKKENHFLIPEWIDSENWDLWMKTRKGKKMINAQMQKQIEKLRKWKDSGQDHAGALEAAAINGYTGLYLPGNKAPPAKKQKFCSTELDYGMDGYGNKVNGGDNERIIDIN